MDVWLLAHAGRNGAGVKAHGAPDDCAGHAGRGENLYGVAFGMEERGGYAPAHGDGGVTRPVPEVLEEVVRT